MKVIAFALVALVAVAAALPEGVSSPEELAKVLADEPEAAKVRFADAKGDNIVFKEGAGSEGAGADDDSDAGAEFGGQIEEVNNNIKKLEESIKETEECAKRLEEQKGALGTLQQQLEHLEKEKEKKILSDKLEKQAQDLSEVGRMSRALRSKFAALKRTQQLIKAKMAGTKSTLQQLDGEADSSAGNIKDGADQIASELDNMHAAQSEILSASHKANTATVKNSLDSTNKIASEAKAAEE